MNTLYLEWSQNRTWYFAWSLYHHVILVDQMHLDLNVRTVNMPAAVQLLSSAQQWPDSMTKQ
jgi:hypothetical protein